MDKCTGRVGRHLLTGMRVEVRVVVGRMQQPDLQMSRVLPKRALPSCSLSTK